MAVYNKVLLEKNNLNWYDIIDNGLYLRGLRKDGAMSKQIQNLIKTDYEKQLNYDGDYISFKSIPGKYENLNAIKQAIADDKECTNVVKECKKLLIEFLNKLSDGDAFTKFHLGSDYAGKSYRTAFKDFIKKLEKVNFKRRKEAHRNIKEAIDAAYTKKEVTSKNIWGTTLESNMYRMAELAEKANDSVHSVRVKAVELIEDQIQQNNSYIERAKKRYKVGTFSDKIEDIVKKKNAKLESIKSYLLKVKKEEATDNQAMADSLTKERDEVKNKLQDLSSQVEKGKVPMEKVQSEMNELISTVQGLDTAVKGIAGKGQKVEMTNLQEILPNNVEPGDVKA